MKLSFIPKNLGVTSSNNNIYKVVEFKTQIDYHTSYLGTPPCGETLLSWSDFDNVIHEVPREKNNSVISGTTLSYNEYVALIYYYYCLFCPNIQKEDRKKK